VLPVTGHAQGGPSPYSANEVMKRCRYFITETKPDNRFPVNEGICFGTVYGLGVNLRVLQDLREAGVKMPWGICVDPKVTLGQQVRVVAKYIDARPNRLHEDFRDLAWEALKDAYPCKG
jgi:Rap1a immunity proteins